jgi:alpha-ribazole phosphatase
MPEVWLARHAKPAMSGVCYGQSDVPVVLDAAQAARELRQQLAPGPDLELWSSPWARCREVAEELGRFLQMNVNVDARLSELSFGAWEGRSYVELERDTAFEVWMQNYETACPPGGETVAELMDRARGWSEERLRERGAARLLVLTHAGVIRSLRAIARDVPYRSVVAEPVPYLVPEILPLAML